MVSITGAANALAQLGARLRAARLARDESMAVFAQRLGVSVPTLRAMERGADTVAIGYWANALWALDRISELDAVLVPAESLLDIARRAGQRSRQRASRRPT
jgi:transcriptional regulator with XRE-family HTH domain